MVMGHEATGTITEAGPGADRGLVGRRVVLQPFVYCGACLACNRGDGNLCSRRRFHGVDLDGAMALALNVASTNIVMIPKAVDAKSAVLVEPLAVALHAVAQAGGLTGSIVLVAGCGPIGLLTGLASRRGGAKAVLGTDVKAQRRAAALAIGFDAVADPSDVASLRPAAMATRPFVDVVFDAVGVDATFAQAVELLVPAGTIVSLGGWQTVQADMRLIVGRELHVRGSFNYRRHEFARAITMLAEAPGLGDLIVSDIVPMHDAAVAFERLASGTHQGLKVALTQPE